jgi:hypothetical protein
MNQHDLDERFEERMEARAERRRARRSHQCQCGDDLPGHCRGPEACPYSDFNNDDECE